MKAKNTPWLIHFLLVVGVIVVLIPIYFAWVASTHKATDLLQAPIPVLPGHSGLHNYWQVLVSGIKSMGGESAALLLWNSFWMALFIAVGKVVVSILSAFAIVYFRFPLRKTCFWLIFLTLMLPVQVRIVPTFQVTASLHLLNSFSGLALPLIASATATFLFRQFFLTMPKELCEAAKMDGASAMRFFWEILLPLSKTNIAALFVIMFVYGWNQYLWPLVVTTQSHMDTVVMGIQKLSLTADQVPQWNTIMAVVVLALIPPVLVMLVMQRWFVKGLVEAEK